MVLWVLPVNVEIAAPLKYLSNFWRAVEMSLTNFEISLDLTSSANCVTCKVNRAATFAISDTKIYVPV